MVLRPRQYELVESFKQQYTSTGSGPLGEGVGRHTANQSRAGNVKQMYASIDTVCTSTLVFRSIRAHARLWYCRIMGQGKTTVISPLLALDLADGNTLVVQVNDH
jgi:hypothetical protein